MQIEELTESERGVLYALLAHLAEADAHIDPSEVLAIDDLAERLGVTDLSEKLMRARAASRTRADLLALVGQVKRPEAREAIRAVLLRLAQADGTEQVEENELIEQVIAAWHSQQG
jgi:uncharacterized tellurite resistance protein B-like protein